MKPFVSTPAMACGTCRYFRVDPNQLTRGFCMHALPNGALIPGPNGPSVIAIRPPVLTDEWCHKWELKRFSARIIALPKPIPSPEGNGDHSDSPPATD